MGKESVLKAAAESGFDLEFKTKKIFSGTGFKTEVNKIFNFNGDILEIDVIASSQTPETHYVIECKGSESTSCLILVRDSTYNEKNSISRLIINNSNVRLVGYSSASPIASSFTGDFYRSQGKELKKLSKNDDGNNFYKAQNQIKNAISAFAENISDTEISYIIPLIVTNSHIWMVDYNSEVPHCLKYKWFLQKIKLDSTLRLYCDQVLATSFLVPVVNINF